MPLFKTFEELPVWQAGKALALKVYRLTNGGHFSRDYELRNQIRRAVVSVSSNIAEGFERGTRKELIHFLYVAKGSIGEVRSQLAVAEALGYVKRAELHDLREDCLRISRQLAAFIQSLREKTK